MKILNISNLKHDYNGNNYKYQRTYIDFETSKQRKKIVEFVFKKIKFK